MAEAGSSLLSRGPAGACAARVCCGYWDHRLKSRNRILDLLAAAALDGGSGSQVEQLDAKHRLSGRRRNTLDEPQLTMAKSLQGHDPSAVLLSSQQGQSHVGFHDDALGEIVIERRMRLRRVRTAITHLDL